MFKLFTSLYIHLYCIYYAPKSWLKYTLYCVLQDKTTDINMLSKIITLRKIKQSLQNYE